MNWMVGRVHRMDGYVPAGLRVRAVCSCGHGTTPHANGQNARRALAAEHRQTAPQCAVCGRDYAERSWEQQRYHLQILTDGQCEYLACRGAPRACRDGAAQRQVHLDRATFEQLGAEPPRPRLRVIRNPDRD